VRHGDKSLNTERKAHIPIFENWPKFVTSGLSEEEGLPTDWDAFEDRRAIRNSLAEKMSSS
jgi:hypothetical protein